MDTDRLLRIARGSKRDREREIRREERESEHREVIVKETAADKQSGAKAGPMYLPIIFASLGFLMGAVLVNGYYCRYPPIECEDGSCEKDRWEKTMSGGVAGALCGVGVYFTVFRKTNTPRAAAEDEDATQSSYSYE